MQVILTMAILTLAMRTTHTQRVYYSLLTTHHALLTLAVSSRDQLGRPEAALVLLGVLLRRPPAPRPLPAILGRERARYPHRAA